MDQNGPKTPKTSPMGQNPEPIRILKFPSSMPSFLYWKVDQNGQKSPKPTQMGQNPDPIQLSSFLTQFPHFSSQNGTEMVRNGPKRSQKVRKRHKSKTNAASNFPNFIPSF